MIKKRRVGDHKLVPLDCNPYEIRRRAIYAFLLCWERNTLLRNCLSRDVALKIAKLVQVEIPRILSFDNITFTHTEITTPPFPEKQRVFGWRAECGLDFYACGECSLPIKVPNISHWIDDLCERTCKSNSCCSNKLLPVYKFSK